MVHPAKPPQYPSRPCSDTSPACIQATAAIVRAEGLEPSRSLEHGHLKPGCLPIPPRPQASRAYRFGRRRICRRAPLSWGHHGGERAQTGAIRRAVRSRKGANFSRYQRLRDRASDGVAGPQELVHFFVRVDFICALQWHPTQLVAGRRVQCPVSNSMGRVVGPLSAVSGFHGAGPVRRALGMRRVITARASANSRRARWAPRQ